MERKILSEELGRMSYLFAYKRGVVVSEQNLVGVSNNPEKSGVDIRTNAPNWNGGSSGNLSFTNFSTDNRGIIVNASNVGYKENLYVLSVSSGIGKNLPYSITKKDPISDTPELTRFEFVGESFPYADNMITPEVNKNVKAESLLYLIRDTIIKNINEGGIDSIKNIKLKGFADSARPTLDVPRGYKGLDHSKVGCDKPYCGERDDSKRNLFLAEQRAKRMSTFLKNLVKQKINVDIPDDKFIFDEPESAFDPNKTDKNIREGKKSVYVEVIPSEPKLGSGVSGEETKVITVVPKPKQGVINYKGYELNVLENIKSNTGYSVITVEDNDIVRKLISNGDIPDLSVTGKINGKTLVKGEITGNEVKIDGLSWGNLTDYEEGSYANMRYITDPGVLCVKRFIDSSVELRVYKVVLSES
jgi:hypothetical protein